MRRKKALRPFVHRKELAQKRRSEGQRELQEFKERESQEKEEEIYERGPLKMFVRDHAWLELIKLYLKRRKADGASTDFKYLTLPGGRGIDIGLLWEAGLLRRRKGNWANVAICDETDSTTIMNRIGTFGAVSALPLEWTLNRPLHELVRFFPVDIINLDFCNAVLRGKSTNHTLTNLETIQKLFALQAGHGFLLLLTHRLGLNDYAGRVKDTMRDTIDINLQENEQFRIRFGEVYGSENVESIMDNLLQFGLLGIAKCVARSAEAWGYSIEEQFVGYYPRPRGYHMGVNSFVVVPIGCPPEKRYSKRFKLSNPALVNMPISVRREATETYSRFVASLPGRPLTDVETILNNDLGLKKMYTEWGERCFEWWKDPKLQD